jgi:hypothetical protein
MELASRIQEEHASLGFIRWRKTKCLDTLRKAIKLRAEPDYHKWLNILKEDVRCKNFAELYADMFPEDFRPENKAKLVRRYTI